MPSPEAAAQEVAAWLQGHPRSTVQDIERATGLLTGTIETAVGDLRSQGRLEEDAGRLTLRP